MGDRDAERLFPTLIFAHRLNRRSPGFYNSITPKPGLRRTPVAPYDKS
jgi:hypothetical protein